MNRKSDRYIKKKISPSILRKKRKAEENAETSSSSSNNEGHDESTFSQMLHEQRMLSAHPGLRPCPLPTIDWAESKEIWRNLVDKETSSCVDHCMFDRHPDLQPRMRAILLDWLIEVCEVYKLHRETFYLSQDLIDRYLSTISDVRKDHLQLVGITCLFIAAKVEEIYPPKVAEFAYVTDGACTTQEIYQQEIIILVNIDWDVTPITVTIWLSIFLQVAAFRENRDQKFELCSFSDEAFGKLCQLLDLCMLDVQCLQFSYGVLAASAIIHLVSKDVGLSVSGYRESDVAACVKWMVPFVETVVEHGKVQRKFFENILDSDAHNIQTHEIGLKLLEQVQYKQQSYLDSIEDLSEMGVLTPPPTRYKRLCLKRV